MCAVSFSKNRKKEKLEIHLHNIPESMFEEGYMETDLRYGQNKMILISPLMTVDQLCGNDISDIKLIRNMFEQMCELYATKCSKKIDKTIFEENINSEINVMLDKLIFERVSEQEGIMVFRYIEDSHFLQYNGNNLYAVAYYFYFRNQHQFRWNEKEQSLLKGLFTYIKKMRMKKILLPNVW